MKGKIKDKWILGGLASDVDNIVNDFEKSPHMQMIISLIEAMSGNPMKVAAVADQMFLSNQVHLF